MSQGIVRMSRGLLLASAMLAGCQSLTKVKVDPATSTLDSAGKTVQFHAEQMDADGKAMQDRAPVEWSSSNAAVATVEKDGTATAKKSGKAAIIATVGALKGEASLEVHIPAKISGAEVTIDGPGKTQVLAASVLDDANQPMPAPPGTLTFDSGDLKVVMVASQGGKWVATGVSAGTTTITAKFGKLTQSFACTVKGANITELKVAPATLKLKVGASQKVTATAMAGASPAAGAAITYASSDAKVATVGADGTVKGMAKGKATITASAGSKTATATVEVKK